MRFRCLTKSGESRHLESSGRAYRSADGELRIVAVSMDIDERVRAEAALQDAEAQLRISQRMESLGRLAGGVAHDFNNMLTVILGSARWMEQHPEDRPESTRELASEIVQAAEKSADLTRQLLAFGRMQIVETQVLDLDERIEQLSRILKSLVGDEITIVVASGRGENFVRADPSQIEQLIVNLVANARDAMPSGGTLSIPHRPRPARRGGEKGAIDLPAGDYVSLEVADTGLGMTAETLSHIFEPFFTTKEVGRGTGLGLSTVYGIVKQSGGEIEVESTLGEGSRFRVLLPRLDGVSEESRAGARQAPAPGRPRRARPAGGGFAAGPAVHRPRAPGRRLSRDPGEQRRGGPRATDERAPTASTFSSPTSPCPAWEASSWLGAARSSTCGYRSSSSPPTRSPRSPTRGCARTGATG